MVLLRVWGWNVPFFLQLLEGGWTDAKMTTLVHSLENSQERPF